METKNLWGDLPEYDKIKTPYVILKEQATLLTKLTNGQLEVRIRSAGLKEDEILIEFNVVSDLLKYSSTILRVTHQTAIIYPLNLYSTLDGERFECNNQEDFESALEKVFQSSEVRGLLANLLANINSES